MKMARTTGMPVITTAESLPSAVSVRTCRRTC